MRVAIVASNYLKIDQDTKKGTEIFVYILINNLVKYVKDKNLLLTAFCSGNSNLPVKIESVNFNSTFSDKSVSSEKHIIFELALISKAFSLQNKFDLYHMNIGNGDIVLPFAQFIKKPILITLHYTIEEGYAKKYFDLFKNIPNVFFVSATNSQRKLLPDLNYVATIYHGIDVYNNFKFDPVGGECIMWAGRAIPQKGLDLVLEVAKQVKKEIQLFAIRKEEYGDWLEAKVKIVNQDTKVSITYDTNRLDLIKHYQSSKLFLFPIQWEEPFGLVMTESMACGAPVVAYARGSVPEIVKDGETGFIVNPSDDDIRGNWIVKKTGIEGLCEAVEKIYSMSREEYEKMRENCRKHVEKHFTVERMVDEYEKVYKKVASMNISVGTNKEKTIRGRFSIE